MADPVPGKQYMTVAVTDLALCLACVYAFRSHMHSSYAFVGFLLFAAAAGTGVLRFALFPGQRVVKRAHEYLSDAVGKVGLPFIALEFVVIARLLLYQEYCNYVVVGLVLGWLVTTISAHSAGETYGSIVSVASLVCIAASSWLIERRVSSAFISAVVGVALFVVAATVVGVSFRERKVGILTVDWFHVLLACSVVCLSNSLFELQTTFRFWHFW